MNKRIDILEIAGIFYCFAIAFAPSTGDLIVKIARVLLFICFIISLIKRKSFKKGLSSYTIWSIIFLLYGAVSYFWAISKQNVLNEISSISYIIICNLMLFYAIKEDNDYIFKIIKAGIFGTIAHGLNLYLTNGFGVYINTRGGDIVENANVIAFVAAFSVIFSFIIVKTDKTNKKWLYIITSIICLIFGILSGSRKIYAFLIAFFVLYYFLKSKDVMKKAFKLLLSLFAVAITFLLIMKIPFLYDLVGSRIETMFLGFFGNSTDGSTSFRIKLLQWGVEWFQQKPFIGYGLDCFKYLLGTQHITWAGVEGVYAHNNYIELLVDCGIIGTFLYYLIYLQVIKKSIKSRNILSIFSLSIIFSMLIFEIGQVSYSYAFLQEVILITYCFSVYNKEKNLE